jgi:hypothetical protein
MQILLIWPKVLQAELAEAKAELQRLRERVFTATHVHKHLSLISLVPGWSGSETGIPLEEFLSSIEGSAQVEFREDYDKIQFAIFQLSDAGKQFYNGCTELHSANDFDQLVIIKNPYNEDNMCICIL